MQRAVKKVGFGRFGERKVRWRELMKKRVEFREV